MKSAAYIIAFILSISTATAQKIKVAILDIGAVGGRYSPEYFIFRNELSSSNYFDILEVEQIDKMLKNQNVKIKSPYELGQILTVEKLIVFSSFKQGSEGTYSISGLDIAAGTKIFDDSIKAETPQQTNIALRICARRSAYRLNNLEITEEIEQQMNQELIREKQNIDVHAQKAAEGRRFYRPFKIPAYTVITASLGLMIAGLVLDSKAAEALNSRNAAYEEYCTATTGIEELWNSAIVYQEDAKNYVKKRNYAYISSAVMFAGGAYLYTIKKKTGKTGVALGPNSILIVYNF